MPIYESLWAILILPGHFNIAKFFTKRISWAPKDENKTFLFCPFSLTKLKLKLISWYPYLTGAYFSTRNGLQVACLLSGACLHSGWSYVFFRELLTTSFFRNLLFKGDFFHFNPQQLNSSRNSVFRRKLKYFQFKFSAGVPLPRIFPFFELIQEKNTCNPNNSFFYMSST